MIGWILTGGMLPGLLMIGGLFFFIYLKGGPFRHPIRMLRVLSAKPKEGGMSPRRALLLALAGTLGVGNLVGVANALWIGGAGAVFWMWVSALVAMILKYAEILLAVAHRRCGEGGFFGGSYYYIMDELNRRKRGKAAVIVGGVVASLMILNGFSMGCIIQANAVSTAFQGVAGVSPWLIGGVLVALACPIILRGTKGISALTEILVPIMTGGYLILSVAVLILRRENLAPAFRSIFQSVFSAEAVGGGLFGFFTSRALKVGTMRGLMSNEAGCGTAPTAHAAADCESPASQGIWGIVEVFVDTIVLCTATAMVILVSYDQVAPLGEDAMMMSIKAYSSVLGGWSEWFFCAAVVCFAFATLLCWANYGMESVRFLSKRRRWHYLYVAAFSACMVIGSVLAPDQIWTVADFAVAALTTINIVFLFLMRKKIRHETEAWEREA
ncbi:MAG: sodium:alanine symporter family protein [Clostridia bacterium]|nr:sodium:alanine symporter family protein [Clostridia bacterium]